LSPADAAAISAAITISAGDKPLPYTVCSLSIHQANAYDL
jgi:hypothetical protein